MQPPTLADVRAARERVSRVVQQTQLLRRAHGRRRPRSGHRRPGGTCRCKKIVCIMSGGSIDRATLTRILN